LRLPLRDALVSTRHQFSTRSLRRRNPRPFTRTYIAAEENPMRAFILIIVLASTYFVEWIPNNVAAPESSPGEFPWQL
jgi:hypothetical protein